MKKIIYSDGNDYSNLQPNSYELIKGTWNLKEHGECVSCGSTEVTITDKADICHDCGYVYT